MKKILVVKLSSLGDVVHAMPAVQDMRQALPGAAIDWVVERGFAPLVERCEGIHAVIPCDLRRWRKSPLSSATRADWRAFRSQLRSTRYDAIIDMQGLTKSALIARVARLAEGGRRIALANRTEGSGYEPTTRWFADLTVRIDPRVHAVTRSRELCAQAFGYALTSAPRYGLVARAAQVPPRTIAFVHGTSRDDKLWPEEHWVALGRTLAQAGCAIALPQGSDEEAARATRVAAQLGDAATVWPRMDLAALCDRLAACAGVIGVDSGLSHIAVALGLPHVQVYNFDTAWRTGPFGHARQRSVQAQPAPTLDAVWQAWQSVSTA